MPEKFFYASWPKGHYFPTIKGELKHKKLSKRKSQWKYLIEIQKDLLQNYDAFSYVCVKKYLLTLLFLDDLVEPYYYDNGVNFHENGQNYALASLLYHTGHRLWGQKAFENLSYYYRRAARSRLDLNINILLDHAKKILITKKELPEVLIPIVSRHQGSIATIKQKESNTDVTEIIVLSLVHRACGAMNAELRRIRTAGTMNQRVRAGDQTVAPQLGISHIEKFVKEPYVDIFKVKKEMNVTEIIRLYNANRLDPISKPNLSKQNFKKRHPGWLISWL